MLSTPPPFSLVLLFLVQPEAALRVRCFFYPRLPATLKPRMIFFFFFPLPVGSGPSPVPVLGVNPVLTWLSRSGWDFYLLNVSLPDDAFSLLVGVVLFPDPRARSVLW